MNKHLWFCGSILQI